MNGNTTITYHGHRHPRATLDNRPLVTFALFTYNQQQFVRDAALSALSQVYEPLEIIFSDDKSTDGTFDILSEIAEQYRGPHRLLLRQAHTNQGVLQHVLDIFRVATGKYVVCAAGDDISLAQRTARLIQTITSLPNCYVAGCSNSILLDETGNIREKLFVRTPKQIHGATSIYLREFFLDLPDNEEKLMLEDKIFTHFIALKKCKFFYLDEQLVLYRTSDHSLSNFNKSNTEQLLKLCAQETQALGYVINNAKHISSAPTQLTQHLLTEKLVLEKVLSKPEQLSWSDLLFLIFHKRWLLPVINQKGRAFQKFIAHTVTKAKHAARSIAFG